jgi:pimeloyl-ACP methyl ester carboxylesterase
VSQLIWKPTLSTSAVHTQVGPGLYLPSTAYSGGLAFLVALATAAGTGVVMLAWVRRRRATSIRTGDRSHDLGRLYAGRGPTVDGPTVDGLAMTDSRAARAVSRTIATSKLTDLSGISLVVVTVPTLVVLIGYQVLLMTNGVKWAQGLHVWASVGGYAGTAATGAFLAYLRSAVTDPSARKRVGFLWDVITFWPRACHPLGPPSYAERSVPEVVTRIRRIVGDDAEPGDPALAQQAAESYDESGAPGYRERHSDVLLVGYSQGGPIATAVMAQLPGPVRQRTRLLTLASPVRRLYGRTFPAYFGREQIGILEARLTEDGRTRWTNLVRETDYIGGYVRSEEPGGIDHWILDPPVLWEDADPSPPLTHLHSNWFSDPQTRSYAEELL